MRLAETRYDNTETGCCAPLDPALWDEKELHWDNKLFLRDHVRALFHVPLNFGAVVGRDHAMIEEAEAYPRDPMWLTDEVSPWRSDLHVAVDREVPGAEIVRLSGTFLTKVFEGPFRDAGKWTRAMKEHVASTGRTLEKIYYYYATCPRCAKKLGVNRVVLVARVR